MGHIMRKEGRQNVLLLGHTEGKKNSVVCVCGGGVEKVTYIISV